MSVVMTGQVIIFVVTGQVIMFVVMTGQIIFAVVTFRAIMFYCILFCSRLCPSIGLSSPPP